MIFDPDGEHAICDDGRMAEPVFGSVLDEYGFPTGQLERIGFAAPGHGPFLAGSSFLDEL